MTRPARLVLLVALTLTLGLLVLATVSGRAGLGPVEFWVVHHDSTTSGSEVRLRPGLGLLGLWAAAVTTVLVIRRRRDV